MTPPREGLARTGTAPSSGGPRAGIASPRRPAPAPDRPRHLEVVRGRPAPGRRPPRALVLAAIGVTAGVILVIVVARVLIGQGGFAESGIEGRIRTARQEVERLQLEVAQLRAPQRISQRAIELGLVVPDQVVFLTPSPAPSASASSSSTAHPSTPASSPGRGGR